jgi:hypothetical protein
MGSKETFAKYVKQPEPEQVIWRYIDFPRFMFMIEISSIFFCQGNQFDDQFEGTLPQEDVPPGSDLENYLKTSNIYHNPLAWRALTLVTC